MRVLSGGCAAFLALAIAFSSTAEANSWTGFYAGINAGYAWTESDSITTSADTVQFCDAGCDGGLDAATASAVGASGTWPIDTSGFIGGLQAGYNYQFGNKLLAGIEVDIQGLAASDSVNAGTVTQLEDFPDISISTELSATKDIDFLGTVRGRIGFLATPTLLLYGTGGLAYGKVESSTSISQAYIADPSDLIGIATAWGSTGSFSDWRAGWTAGGGGEWIFRPNASIKFEYLYYDLGDATYSGGTLVDSFTPPPPPPAGTPAFFANEVRSRIDNDGHIVRIGLSGHF